jgi:succinoglycan biosynthesis transport protein ExoP
MTPLPPSSSPAPHETIIEVPGALPRPQRSRQAPLRQLLVAVRRRWRLVAGFALAGLTLMAVVCLVAPRSYTATAVLHVNNQPPHVTSIPQVVTPPTYFEGVEFFQDQVKFLESRSLAARVIRDEGLDHQARFVYAEADWPVVSTVGRSIQRAAEGLRALVAEPDAATTEGAPEAPILGVPPGLIGRYGRWLEVKPITNSRLIEVSFTSPSPALSQHVANAHVAAYIRRSLEAKFQLTGEARHFLESEIERVQGELTQAEDALNAFRRRHALVTLDDSQNAIVERLTDLGRRLTQAQAERISAESEWRLVEGRDRDALPAVLTNPLIQGLKQEASRLEIRQSELGEVFLPRSEQMREINSQLDRAQTRLRREIDRAVGGIESAFLAASAREASLREQFERQQDAVLDQKELTGQYMKLDQRVTTARTLYATLVQRLGETDVVKGVQLSNAAVVDPAELPGAPSHPAVPFNLAFGLLFGTGVGLAVAFALEHLDGSLKTPDEVRSELSLPTLGVVPDFTRLDRPHALGLRRPRLLARAARPLELVPHHSPSAEAYRSVRTSILFWNPTEPPRSLLVTSSQPREGKTATTVNLAMSFAQLGRRVVVVDADMRQARCHRALGLPSGAGLSDVLLDGLEPDAAIRHLAVLDGGVRVAPPGWTGCTMHVLPAGRCPADSSALLASPRMDEVLARLLERFDLVLIDSPPVFPIADSAILAPRVDGVVLVVRGHITDRQVSREALARLHYMQARVMGVVLNAVDPGSSAYHSYSYYFAA